MKRQLKKSNLVIIGVLVVLACAGIITAISSKNTHNDPAQTIIKDTGYTTLLPEGKSIIQLGGWIRISPTKSDPVYAYNDSLSGVTISVSEQPLPASFKSDVADHVLQLAKSYNATSTIKAGETTVYVGTSAQGPQSVIFSKNDLLILIKSENNIQNTAWSSYAVSLK